MQPLVSIVIPVGPAHVTHASVAVASCLYQTVPNIEVLVINDARKHIPLQDDPRIRVLEAPAKVGRRSSIARNTGFRSAAAPFVVPLDADDYLLPTALANLLIGHAQHDACYSYGWHYGVNKQGIWGLFRSPDYDREKLKTFNLHPITALVPTAALAAAGGCDEGAPGLEDWTLWLNLARIGCCGQQIYGPTFVYRRDEGVNHIVDVNGGVALMDAVRARYQDAAGEIQFMGCGCGSGDAAKAAARQAAPLLGKGIAMSDDQVILEYIGPGDGGQWYGGPGHSPTGQRYKAGRGPAVRYIGPVPKADADYLVGLRLFRIVPPPAAFVPPPEGVVAAGTVAESFAVPPPEGQASPYPGRKARKG